MKKKSMFIALGKAVFFYNGSAQSEVYSHWYEKYFLT